MNNAHGHRTGSPGVGFSWLPPLAVVAFVFVFAFAFAAGAACSASNTPGRLRAAVTIGDVDALTFDRLETLSVWVLRPAAGGNAELACSRLMDRLDTPLGFSADFQSELDIRAVRSLDTPPLSLGSLAVFVEGADAAGIGLAAACSVATLVGGEVTEVTLTLQTWGDRDGDGASPAGGDCDDGDPSVGLLATETCDDRDNDCDGGVDEGCSCAPDGITHSCYFGPPGTIGLGGCVLGNQECIAGTWSDCGGLVSPTMETCDTVDNDCDGTADEGCPCVTEGDCFGAPGAPMGTCMSGTQACEGGTFGLCVGQVLPVTEICASGEDEDCDGLVDENCPCQPGEMRPCYAGDPADLGSGGPCAEGTQTCDPDGLWGPCMGEILPAPEGTSCDNTDNDCDGLVDDIVAGCYDLGDGGCNSDGTGCAGACIGGHVVCNAGVPTCMGAAGSSTEICGDGIDNDCNGTIDSDAPGPNCRCDDVIAAGNTGLTCYSGPAGTEGVGTCSSGNWSCMGNQNLGICSFTSGPGTESCNGMDDDCDGFTDNAARGLDTTLAPITMACGIDTGMCRMGTVTCVGGSFGDCEGEIVAEAEQCDGLDHDCDGEINDVDEDGDGFYGCAFAGTPGRDCDDGNPFVNPDAIEVCDGVDNDCDGSVDNDGDGDGFGPCPDGDGLFDCDETRNDIGPAAMEVCNGRDDDCDGSLGPTEVDVDMDGALACDNVDTGVPADCSDIDDSISPLLPEICDSVGIDTDCTPNNEHDACGGDLCCGGGCVPESLSNCGPTCATCSTMVADTCLAGACSCGGAGTTCNSSTSRCCGSSCVPLDSTSHCGGCGMPCNAQVADSCDSSSGSCMCGGSAACNPATERCCGGGCVSLTSTSHCGGCGIPCSGTLADGCNGTSCTCGGGAACVSPATCTGGTCL